MSELGRISNTADAINVLPGWMFDIETIVSISIVVATIDALNTAGGREQLEKGAVRSLIYTFELFWLPHRT